MIMLSSGEPERCITLAIVKCRLRHISHYDRVLPSRMTRRILISTGSGDLVSGMLDLSRSSFDLEVVNLFPDGWTRGRRGSSPAWCVSELLLILESRALPQNFSEGI